MPSRRAGTVALASASLLLAGLAALACSAPTSSSSSAIEACTPGEDCPEREERKPRKNKKGPDDLPILSDEPAPDPSPAPTTPATPRTDDAGTPLELGTSCKKLKACCDAFVKNGVFSDFCFEALNTGKESVCYTKHQSYITDPENMWCE